MILQALKEYYDRKASDPDSIAPFGWERKQIPYVIVLDVEGNAVNIESTYEGEGKKKQAKSFIVPEGVKRASGIASNLLWDNPEYVLGISGISKDGVVEIARKADEKTQAFYDRITSLGDIDDQGLKATLKFVSKSPNEKIEDLKKRNIHVWQELLLDKKALITFKLDGASYIVARSEIVKKSVNAQTIPKDAPKRRCLVTNEEAPIKVLHQSIKEVWGGNTSGTNIVSFNLDSFCSYGKKQGDNAPVSVDASFAYTTALNKLLEKGSPNRFQVGEASTVVWGEKNNELETNLPSIFTEPPKENDDPDRGVEAVKQIYASIKNGGWTDEEKGCRFYILGLSPNAARLAIRFWQVSTVKETSESIIQYFDDIKIVHGSKDSEYLSISKILKSLAVQGKTENIPPFLEGGMIRAIFERTPFPNVLLQAAVCRNRAEQFVSYPRASIIKACINRSTRFYHKN